jgi:hypothetical protein
VNMIETLIIVRGKQIKAKGCIFFDLQVHFWCQNKGVACHREMSF